MTILLDFLYIIAAVFYLPAFFFRGKHRLGLSERCGIYAAEKLNKLRGREFIWLHAVSVGEVKAAGMLLKKIRSAFPDKCLVISTVTPTGNAVARDLAGEEDVVIYLPFDLSRVVAKALKFIRPKMLLIMETEIWPNLLGAARKMEIPVFLLNGRISDKAFPRYKAFKFFFQPVINKFSLLCMQSEKDARRMLALGAAPERVKVVGNIKFDQPEDIRSIKMPSVSGEEKLIVCGSTHANEEEMLVRVYQRLKPAYPRLRLLLAPRHTHRVKDIEAILRKSGLPVLRLSALAESEDVLKKEAVFVLDIMGVLGQIYRIADLVFIGGSLIAHGGQNPLEAAVYHKPMVFGPHMFNFQDISRMLIDGNAALSVRNEEELYLAFQELLKNPAAARALGENAARLVQANKGSGDKIISLLKEYSSR